MKKRIVVVGGGAAGLFAAIHAKETAPDSETLVLEKTNQLLSKVRISGGGRCNVTHSCFDPLKLTSYYPRGAKELLGPFHHFQPQDTIAWFKKRGVTLKTEADGRMFPVTDSSETIIACLLKAAEETGVVIHKMQRIQSCEKKDHLFYLDDLAADALILATGSSSWGHQIAAHLGHTIIRPVPSLFTFNTPTSPLLGLAGITLPDVTLTLGNYVQRGPLLLTHWGFSGPAALKLSAFAARELYEKDYRMTLHVNWLSAKNEEAVFQMLMKKDIPLPVNLARKLLPPLTHLSHKELRPLARKLFQDSYEIEGTTTNKQEFVTAGGVSLKEIDCKTFQSKLCPQLYFAGEILNIDGVTGGFNFQNAWTTGFIAGSSAGKSLFFPE